MFENLKKQEHFLKIWEMRHRKDEVSTENREYIDAMEMHPEYREIWDSSNIYEVMNRSDEVNPFLHITLHTILKRQMDNKDPEPVHLVYKHLTEKKGIDSHKAMHSLMLILSDEIYDMMKEKRVFDRKNYEKRMRKFLKM